jgi:surface protein
MMKKQQSIKMSFKCFVSNEELRETIMVHAGIDTSGLLDVDASNGSPIALWWVSDIYRLSGIFRDVGDAFDTDLETWDTSKATTMSYMVRYEL